VEQDFPAEDVEIIVVDDGSTDDTPQRMTKWGRHILYIRKENGGQASAYNVGFESSRGEIVCFLDADDYWHRSKLKRVVQQFLRDKATMVIYHPLEVVDGEGNALGVMPRRFNEETVLRIPSSEYFQGINRLSPPSSGISVRAECLRNVMPVPLELRLAADSYLHFFLPLYAECIHLLTTPLGVYRAHGESHGINPLGKQAYEPRKVQAMLDARRVVARHQPYRKPISETILQAQRVAIESEVAKLEILLHNVSGEKRQALHKAWSYRKSVPGQVESGIIALVLYAVLPPMVFNRLKKFYRSLVPRD
jgi:glycosyltransferase involved in cell wall biosynthesis